MTSIGRQAEQNEPVVNCQVMPAWWKLVATLGPAKEQRPACLS
jgi:hypothetical protein